MAEETEGGGRGPPVEETMGGGGGGEGLSALCAECRAMERERTMIARTATRPHSR